MILINYLLIVIYSFYILFNDILIIHYINKLIQFFIQKY